MQVGPPAMDSNLPFPAPVGQNPFHVKGFVVQGVREFIEKSVPGGMTTAMKRISDPAVVEYLSQPFLAASWYDAIAYINFIGAGGSASGRPRVRYYADHAVWQIERDLKGVNAMLYRAETPEALAGRMGTAWGRSFDFAQVETLEVMPGSVIMSVRSMPAPFLSDRFAICTTSAA